MILAEKFGISLGGNMAQLPTYILFENAVEVTRFPELNFEKASHPPITKVFPQSKDQIQKAT